MYLKSLYINGFKSFAQKTNLDFKSKISAIVGPNGSGKSNVAEAFRFVLGEQSMKNMRGKRGEDLIFTGKKGQMNRGSVKVIFDNSDKTLNIDYDEVVIERVVFRDGNNEYLINGSKVRAKDVIELLGGANIGSTGHHIISQGEADKILAISPKDRKIVIEEALGLKAFVLRKSEAERKLQKTEENIKEAKTREKVNAPRIRFLEKEVEKIKKAKEMREELKHLYSLFFSNKVQVKNQIKDVEEKLFKQNKDREEIVEKINLRKKELKENENLNKNESDSDKSKKIEKINFEKNEVEQKKNILQKNFIRNELFVETEERKREIFLNQKDRVEENLKKYNFNLESISTILHKNWQKLVESILDSEDISKEKKEEWKKDFVEYQFLSENSKQRNNSFAIEILEFFGIQKEGILKEDFNSVLIEEKRKENKIINQNILNLDEVLESLNKKIQILNSNSENSEEIFSQEIEIEILKMEKILSSINSGIVNLNSKKFMSEREIEVYKKEESFAISFFGHSEVESFFKINTKNPLDQDIIEKITRIRILLENFGTMESENLINEYEQLKENQEFVKKELSDLIDSKDKLNKLIINVIEEIEKKFRIGVEKINQEFSEFFKTLFMGGKAEIFLVQIPIKNDEDDGLEEFELGLDVKVSLPNKKISGLGMLSGGERSLTSIALLFAMSSITPPPFIILDETDAALDEANSKKYGDMIELLAEHSQLILITHNRETMSRAGLLYGVTMGDEGTSKLLSVSFEEAQAVAK